MNFTFLTQSVDCCHICIRCKASGFSPGKTTLSPPKSTISFYIGHPHLKPQTSRRKSRLNYIKRQSNGQFEWSESHHGSFEFTTAHLNACDSCLQLFNIEFLIQMYNDLRPIVCVFPSKVALDKLSFLSV